MNAPEQSARKTFSFARPHRSFLGGGDPAPPTGIQSHSPGLGAPRAANPTVSPARRSIPLPALRSMAGMGTSGGSGEVLPGLHARSICPGIAHQLFTWLDKQRAG